MSNKKKKFVINNNSVRALLCGPTVYEHSHVGHARMLLFYDMVSRYFKFKGAQVSVIVNITDIDQKIFAKSRLMGSSPEEVAAKFMRELFCDLSSLGIDNFVFARVSDLIEIAQHSIIQLIESGKAYSA